MLPVQFPLVMGAVGRTLVAVGVGCGGHDAVLLVVGGVEAIPAVGLAVGWWVRWRGRCDWGGG